MTKKVMILTWGCQMNEYDSELIRSILDHAGFVCAADEDSADVILLNTCSVRESAVRKIYGKVHEIHHKRNGRPVKIGILGCMATSQKEELLNNRRLDIDFIAGPDSYRRLPEIIENSISLSQKAMDISLSKKETYSGVNPKRESSVNAWIAIMRGCDNFCSFCVVPYARGRERSRTPQEILDEIEQAAVKGFKQVTLLGQNVNSYKRDYSDSEKDYADSEKDYTDFVGLLEKITQIQGIERIRFLAPHPKDFPERLLVLIAGNPKICKHIHLPLQSGNGRILGLMNRGYAREDYLALVHKMRKAIPGVALTTDIIVGFPTETDEEFQDTYGLMKDVEFDSAFIFKYSPRKGTAAAKKFPDDVSEVQKTKRIVSLNHLQNRISFKINQSYVGRVEKVLIEQQGTPRSKSQIQGRTDSNKIVILPSGKHCLGDLVDVKITDATVHVLKAKPEPH